MTTIINLSPYHETIDTNNIDPVLEILKEDMALADRDLVCLLLSEYETNKFYPIMLATINFAAELGKKITFVLDWQYKKIQSLWLPHADIRYVNYFIAWWWNRYPINNHSWNCRADNAMLLTGGLERINRIGLLAQAYKTNFIKNLSFTIPYLNELTSQSVRDMVKMWDISDPDEFFQYCIKHKTTGLAVDSTFTSGMLGQNEPTDSDMIVNMFSNTRFSIVSETAYAHIRHPFITEKTWMAIINHHPFILSGHKGCYAALQSLGIKSIDHLLPVTDTDGEMCIDKVNAAIKNAEWLVNNRQHDEEIERIVLHNFDTVKKLYQESLDVINDLSTLLSIPDQELFTAIINNTIFYAAETKKINSILRNDRKTQWCIFYQNIKDHSWPSCESPDDLDQLPGWIQDEIKNVFGWQDEIIVRKLA
jgi:hypothetical protein